MERHYEFDHHANTVQLLLATLLQELSRSGGSSTCDILTLRDCFAQVIPYDDPLFLQKFSDFGFAAREVEEQQGRQTYKVGGLLPPAGYPIQYTPAYILPPALLRGYTHQTWR